MGQLLDARPALASGWVRVGTTEIPLGDQLLRLPTPPARSEPLPTSFAGLVARHPTLSGLDNAALAALTCPRCHGDGQIGPVDACESCRGTGLCCPGCHGARWVRDRLGTCMRVPRLVPCPGCPDNAATRATIVAFVQAEYARLAQAVAL